MQLKRIKYIMVVLGTAMVIHVQAQTNYVDHVIVQGETLSALAKQYGTTVGDIMRLNHMNSKSILKLGEHVKIPSKGAVAQTSAPEKNDTVATPQPKVAAPAVVAAPPATNTTTQSAPATGNAPTHVVKRGETLYGISKQYHIYVADVRKWNNLTDKSVIKEGQVLIVGAGTANVAKTESKPQPTTAPPPVQQPAVTEKKPAEDKTAVKAVVPAAVASTTVAPPPANKPAGDINLDAAPAKKPDVVAPPAAVPAPVPATTAPAVTAPATTAASTAPADAAHIAPEGYFTTMFAKGVEGRDLKSTTGNAMTFKSASGWTDKKYYILINDVPPGSIVKVVYNNKPIYAKVLWNMGGIKENEGLDFRISNAAANALGITDAKFNVTVTYYE
jgi:LysM repeat protein